MDYYDGETEDEDGTEEYNKVVYSDKGRVEEVYDALRTTTTTTTSFQGFQQADQAEELNDHRFEKRKRNGSENLCRNAIRIDMDDENNDDIVNNAIKKTIDEAFDRIDDNKKRKRNEDLRRMENLRRIKNLEKHSNGKIRSDFNNRKEKLQVAAPVSTSAASIISETSETSETSGAKNVFCLGLSLFGVFFQSA